MNFSFDEKSQEVIKNAKIEMLKLKHPYVGSEHLLLSVLSDEELDITRQLKTYGITYNKFYTKLVQIIGIGKNESKWFLFTPMLRKILDNSQVYSNGMITPKDLVLSLLFQGDGIANRILWCLEVDVSALYKKLSVNYKVLDQVNENSFLEKIAINMNKNSIYYEPIYAREKEIDTVIRVLLKKKKGNPLLVGSAGVGKTAVVEELARRVVQGNVPTRLKGTIIYNLPLSSVISGTKYRGEFEEKFQKIIDEIRNSPNIILFIDEIHTIIGAGGAEGAIDAANIIKPYIARNDIRIIGATTMNEYYKTIEKDQALARRFEKIIIDELSGNEVHKIILKKKVEYEKYHGVVISNQTINKIVKFSNEFILNRSQPDKAIDLMDEVCTFCVLKHQKETNITNLYLKRDTISNEINSKIRESNTDKAIYLRKGLKKIITQINNIEFSNEKIIVTEDDLYQVIYLKTKIPINNNYKKLNNYLLKNNKLKDIVTVIENNDFKNNSNPLVFLLNGSNDIEKLKAVELLAKNLFNNVVIKIDLSDCLDISSFKKQKSYLEENTFLSEIEKHIFKIILIENIDCCRKSLFDYFMKSIHNGYFTDFSNNKYFIKKSIVFLTTNIQSNSIGFGNDSEKSWFNNYEIDKIINFN